MNADAPSDHPAIHYYDSDYPWREGARYPENFDATTEFQGIAHDVAMYVALAAETGGPVLELCCGTGRVAVPLARAGFEVTAVDLLEPMLARFRDNLDREPAEVGRRIRLVRADIAGLALERRDYPLAILGFNSLLVLADRELQMRALASVAGHLGPGGRLALDIVNPLALNLEGNAPPRPFFTRRNPHSGNRYTRFAMLGPMDATQRQELSGWYDEIDPGGVVHRRPYSMHWRLVFRYEAELMLERAGFELESLAGGHRGEPFRATSSHMVFRARRRAC